MFEFLQFGRDLGDQYLLLNAFDMFVSCLWFLRSLHRSPRSLFEVTLDDIGGANAEIDRSLSSRRAKDDAKDAEDRVEAKAEAKADPDANGTTGPTQEGS